MAKNKYILALDQGTTSSRAIVFGHDGRSLGVAQQEFEQILPSPGHVEHDPEAIWSSQLAVARQALANAKLAPADIAAVGQSHHMLDQVVVVFVIKAPGAADDDTLGAQIIDVCRERLADFKVPRAVYVVDEFPRATLDKVAKNQLREMADARKATS